GQLRPDAGTIAIDGRPTAGLPPRTIARFGVGRTFQVAATFASMTVRENVQMALLAHARRHLRPWGMARGQLVAEADGLLALVGMADAAERGAGILAYGDLRRLELAMALAGAPRLLLLDEPTAGMAPAERAGLMAAMTRVASERNLAVLFTEHDMDVVFGHATRILVLDRGRIIAAGSPDTVRRDPKVRAVYLGSETAAVP
ncbi:MAG: ATP-binding cassette domain-containing protein, partial [Alphaproteobacteria bacterium]|nr:ATP-binding cassette domain-containing protein [Alphaproteobacteria bacterium]